MPKTQLILAMFATAIVAACGGEAGPKRDASAVIACRDFRKTVNDLGAGILNEADLRTRIKQVHENARLVDNSVAPGVRDTAQSLLATVTTGTTEDAAKAIKDLQVACDQPAAR
jgi:hypothetical protein